MMNVYTGIEKVLKQMLIYDKLDVTDSPEWHEKVLKKAGEIGILPTELQPVLAKFLSFRNFSIVGDPALDDSSHLSTGIFPGQFCTVTF